MTLFFCVSMQSPLARGAEKTLPPAWQQRKLETEALTTLRSLTEAEKQEPDLSLSKLAQSLLGRLDPKELTQKGTIEFIDILKSGSSELMGPVQNEVARFLMTRAGSGRFDDESLVYLLQQTRGKPAELAAGRIVALDATSGSFTKTRRLPSTVEEIVRSLEATPQRSETVSLLSTGIDTETLEASTGLKNRVRDWIKSSAADRLPMILEGHPQLFLALGSDFPLLPRQSIATLTSHRMDSIRKLSPYLDPSQLPKGFRTDIEDVTAQIVAGAHRASSETANSFLDPLLQSLKSGKPLKLTSEQASKLLDSVELAARADDEVSLRKLYEILVSSHPADASLRMDIFLILKRHSKLSRSFVRTCIDLMVSSDTNLAQRAVLTVLERFDSGTVPTADHQYLIDTIKNPDRKPIYASAADRTKLRRLTFQVVEAGVTCPARFRILANGSK